MIDSRGMRGEAGNIAIAIAMATRNFNHRFTLIQVHRIEPVMLGFISVVVEELSVSICG